MWCFGTLGASYIAFVLAGKGYWGSSTIRHGLLRSRLFDIEGTQCPRALDDMATGNS